jgi:hypothetical protein
VTEAALWWVVDLTVCGSMPRVMGEVREEVVVEVQALSFRGSSPGLD